MVCIIGSKNRNTHAVHDKRKNTSIKGTTIKVIPL